MIAYFFRWLILPIAVVAIGVWLFIQLEHRMHKMYYDYKDIYVGMTLLELEQLLGPGQEISRQEVPQSPDYSEPDLEKQWKPVVNGDRFFRWKDDDGREIIVSLVNDRVSEKRYSEPSF